MQNLVINVNGQILGPESAKVSVFDRGFLYGDSLYEVIRSYQGKLPMIEEHLERLAHSAELCRMELGQTIQEYQAEIQRTFDSFKALPETRNSEAYIRLIVTRGTGTIGFGLSCLRSKTQFIIIAQPLERPQASQLENGISLQVSRRLRNDPRALDPAMKSGNYLNSLLAYLEASDGNFDDALLCNSEYHVTEGTTFNVFYVRRGLIATPPLDIGILDGITRRHVIQLARSQGIEVREVRFPKERLYEADEVFVTSTIKEVLGVTKIDGKKINNGKPGPVTRKLEKAFHEWVQISFSKNN